MHRPKKKTQTDFNLEDTILANKHESSRILSEEEEEAPMDGQP